MLRTVLTATAFVAAFVPALALADDRDDRGRWRHGGYDRVESFWRDGCLVERVWKGRGRYEERVDCRGGRRGDWRDRDHDDDDDWRRGDWRGDRVWHDDRYAVVFFDDRARVILSRYYGAPYAPWRGYDDHWSRPYWIGRPLPREVAWRPAPYDLVRRLPPPPYGHFYATVGRDLLLVADATRLVIDAALLSGR